MHKHPVINRWFDTSLSSWRIRKESHKTRTWKLYQRVDEKKKGKCFTCNNNSFHTICLTDLERDESSVKGFLLERGKQEVKQRIPLSFSTQAVLTRYTHYSFNDRVVKVNGLRICTYTLKHILVFTYNFIASVGYWKRFGFFFFVENFHLWFCVTLFLDGLLGYIFIISLFFYLIPRTKKTCTKLPAHDSLFGLTCWNCIIIVVSRHGYYFPKILLT